MKYVSFFAFEELLGLNFHNASLIGVNIFQQNEFFKGSGGNTVCRQLLDLYESLQYKQ